MEPLGVHHVSINVDDMNAARRFYTEDLGLTERDDRPDVGFDGAWLDAGGQQIHLISGVVPKGEGQHFALQVADLDAVIDELRSRGVKVGKAVPIGTGRQSFVLDPSGNLVELHQAGK
jgi:glyoxylase I family protein